MSFKFKRLIAGPYAALSDIVDLRDRHVALVRDNLEKILIGVAEQDVVEDLRLSGREIARTNRTSGRWRRA